MDVGLKRVIFKSRTFCKIDFFMDLLFFISFFELSFLTNAHTSQLSII